MSGSPISRVAVAEWARFASARILFAHQSVGRSIIDGVNALAQTGSLAPIRVSPVASGINGGGGALLHVEAGENGRPVSKIRAFARVLEQDGLGDALDVAVLKFCFWDFRRDSDTPTTFNEYRSTISRLQRRFPRLRFVHATVPLMTADRDWRAQLRRLLGRPVPRTLDNARRHEFSNLIRAEYGGREPIFDLESAETGGRTSGRVPALSAAFSTDGGHLNADGQKVAAEAFVHALSAAAGRVTGAGAPGVRQP